jgi:hypothetical protein
VSLSVRVSYDSEEGRTPRDDLTCHDKIEDLIPMTNR